MFGWFRKRKVPPVPVAPVPVAPPPPPRKADGLRAVPGAGIYQGAQGRVIYNMLDPLMQQFMGRCVGAIKKAGIGAKGTGQFSVLLGDDDRAELQLDRFWSEFVESKDPAVFERVAAAARAKVGGG